MRTRSVYCASSIEIKRRYPDFMCNTIAKPKTIKPCNSSKSCPPMWYGSSWSKVSVEETFILSTYKDHIRACTIFIPLFTKNATTNYKSSSHIHFNNNFFVSVLVYYRLRKRNTNEKCILRSQRKRNRLLKNFIT